MLIRHFRDETLFRTKLGALRFLAGISDLEMATRIGVKRNAYKPWERGETQPRGANLLRLETWAREDIKTLLAPVMVIDRRILPL